MKKFDLYLASAMFIIALVWFFIQNNISESGDYILVYKDNDLVAEYDLSDSGEYSVLDGETEILLFKLKNGSADVTYSTCKDKYCVNQKNISKTGEMICCLPNKIVIEVASKNNTKDTDYDALSY